MMLIVYSLTFMCFNAVLLCTGRPVAIQTSTLNEDSQTSWTTADFRDVDIGGKALEVILKNDSSDVTIGRNVTSEDSNFDTFIQDTGFANWTVNEDPSFATDGFRLSSEVNVPDMNSSGEETAENIQHENMPKVPHSEEELEALLGSLHSAIIDANLFLGGNMTDMDNEAGNATQTDVDFWTSDTTHSKRNNLIPITLANNLPSSESPESVNHTVTEGMILENELQEFQTSRSNTEDITSDLQHSVSIVNESNSTDITENSILESTVEVVDHAVEVLNETTKNKIHLGTESTVSNRTNFDEEKFSTTVTLKVADTEVETEIPRRTAGVESTQTLSSAAPTTLPSVDTAPNSPSCPESGTCILWFLARHACETDNDCSDSRKCCQVRCSRTCIDL